MHTKKEPIQIWPLIRVDGDYEDRNSEAIKAFYSKEDAMEEKKRLQEYYDKLMLDYDSISFDVSDKKHNAFMELLKDVNPEEYELAVKAFDDSGDYDEEFDYDRFYDECDKFCDYAPDFEEYLRKTGCTDEEIRLIRVSNEVDKLWGGFPYFYVPTNPIDLL